MVFKINISDKTGKTYKLEAEANNLIGKELNDKVQGKEILPDLNGYELEITGASDNAGLTSMKQVEGTELKKVLLNYGKAMHKKSKGVKKKSKRPQKGLRLRRTVRGKVISPSVVQINIKVLKEGSKKLAEIFPDQIKKEEKKEG